MPQRIIALEIDDAELKVAVLETTFRDYRVAALHRAVFASADGSFEEQLRRFVEQHEISGDAVLSALPGDSVTWRKLFLPFRDRKRVVQTVPFELENHVPFDLDDVVVDFQILHRDRAGTTVLAALVRREDLERHLSLMRAAGLDPKVVDLGPLATLNALRLLGDLPSSFAFLNFGSRTVTAALFRDGELAGLRTLTPPGGDHAEDGEARNGDGNGRSAAPAALAGEIRWTLMAMNGGPLDDGLPCFVAGEHADVEVVRPDLERCLGVGIRSLDELQMRDAHFQSDKRLSEFTTSVGLALREVSANAGMGLNFRRGEYAYQRGQEQLHRTLRGVAALAALVVALTVTDLYIGYRNQAAQVVELKQQILSVAQATLPDLRDARRPMVELQEEMDARQHELDILNEIVPVSSSTSIDIFRAVSAAIPNSIRLDADDYMMDADAIRMRGNTDSFESVEAIKQHVLGTGFFSEVQVRDARAARDGGVDFRLIMRLAKDVRRSGGLP